MDDGAGADCGWWWKVGGGRLLAEGLEATGMFFFRPATLHLLYYTALYYSTLPCTALPCPALPCTVLHCTLHHTALSYTVLHCTALHYATLLLYVIM